MSQNLPKRSLGDVLSLRHPNHFVLAGANNRKVIITYRFLAAPVQANRDFFYIECVTVYFNCKYFPWYTRELLECLLGISPSGRNPYGGNNTITNKCNKFNHRVACENIRFSSLFPLETSPAAKSEEKRMFSQANHRGILQSTERLRILSS